MRRGAEQQRLAAAAQVQYPVREDMAAFEIAAS